MDRAALERLRRDIVFRAELGGRELTLHSTWGTFSPREVDEGSRMLIDRLEIEPGDDCLDLGCGYGPIGLAMAVMAPEGRTLMVDRDFKAVEYARANARRNGIDNAEAMLSNGFESVGERRFDVIASNIPAKVGKEMLQLFVADAFDHLHPGGRFYVVTITGLRQFFKRVLADGFGNYKKLKQGPRYTVAMATRPD